MDIITDNLKLIVFVVLGVLYWIGNKSTTGNGAPGNPGQEGEPDANDARRIADIQAEIRRKIAERSGKPVPTREPSLRPEPVQQEQVHHEESPFRQQHKTEPFRPVQQVARVSSEPAFDRAAYQRDIDEKMRQVKEIEARAARAARSRRPSRKAETNSAYSQPVRPLGGLSLRQELHRDVRSRHGMKKAFLLKEILGEPIGETGPKE